MLPVNTFAAHQPPGCSFGDVALQPACSGTAQEGAHPAPAHVVSFSLKRESAVEIGTLSSLCEISKVRWKSFCDFYGTDISTAVTRTGIVELVLGRDSAQPNATSSNASGAYREGVVI
jgi:hypothetical protein